MYNNYPRQYMNNYPNAISQQNMYDQIDGQITQLQQMKEQIKNSNQPAINQTFQLAPSNMNGIKYANNIDEVQKETILSDTPFFSKDMSVVWIKNANGNIKAYELTEIIEKDEKDIQIELLQAQINEMKGMINNAKSSNEYINEPVKDEKSTNVSVHRTSTKKQK